MLCNIAGSTPDGTGLFLVTLREAEVREDSLLSVLQMVLHEPAHKQQQASTCIAEVPSHFSDD